MNRVALCALLVLRPPPAGAAAQAVLPPPLDSAGVARWREDLRFLAAEMPKRHANLYHTVARADFDGAVRRLDARIPGLQRHQIILELARLAALVGDGHTSVSPWRDPKIGFHALPLRLYPFSDGLRVRAADSAHAGLVGARVVRIGRATADEAITAVRPLVGRDNEMGVRYAAPFLLVMPEVLHGLGLIDDLNRVPLVLERGGQRQEVVLAPAGPAPILTGDVDRSWDVPEGWVDARGAPERWPVWLRRPDDRFRLEYIAPRRALYAQYDQVADKSGETVARFSDRLFAFARSHPVERLILDVRLNGGGNGELNRPLLLGIIRDESLGARGRLFVLTGRRTFSAAQFFVSQLEDWAEPIFVGEPTASRGNHYGDSRKIVLPNSGITVRVSTLYWQFADPRDTRPWTPPDIATDYTFEDYRRNRDPALETALTWTPEPALAERLRAALDRGGRTAMDTAYRGFTADRHHRYVETEGRLNALGYDLLNEGRIEDAVAVFTLNAAAHPSSANVHDSRGEALAVAGDTAGAIREYEAAVRLNPDFPGSAERLGLLRARSR